LPGDPPFESPVEEGTGKVVLDCDGAVVEDGLVVIEPIEWGSARQQSQSINIIIIINA
jgi:hypothetical protein